MKRLALGFLWKIGYGEVNSTTLHHAARMVQIYIKIAIYKPVGIKKREINSRIAFPFDGKVSRPS